MARHRGRALGLMLAPYLLGLVLLVIGPAIATAVLAFADYDLIGSLHWIGIANFAELAADPAFRAALGNSLEFAAIAVPLRLLLAFALALLLHRRTPLGATATTTATLPTAVPEVAYGLLWLWLLNPLYGPVNQIIRAVDEDGSAPAWLTDPAHARAGIVLMSLFTIAETFVVLLVARRSVPAEVYELAALEGATARQTLSRVTLPLMAPVLALLLLRDTILSLQFSFTPALVVTDGGPPPYGTTYLPLFVYRNAFEYLRYGYAAAATLVMLVLTAAAVLVQWRVLRRYRLPWS